MDHFPREVFLSDAAWCRYLEEEIGAMYLGLSQLFNRMATFGMDDDRHDLRVQFDHIWDECRRLELIVNAPKAKGPKLHGWTLPSWSDK